MTKIDIISGFLGAGKTTFIKKMIQEAFAGEQVVLIENEFGEIGIDGGFLKEAGIEIREMNSGCICCSLVGDFGASLKEVIDTYHPDRVIIEPSGVGKLSDVMAAVKDAQKEIEMTLNSYTTVVDVTKCRVYSKNFGEFFKNQIEYAGAVILSRTDKASAEKIEEGVKIVRDINGTAPLITTPISMLTGADLLTVMEQGGSDERERSQALLAEEDFGHDHHHDHAHHDHGHHHHDHDHHHHDENCGCGHDHHHDHHHHDENCGCGHDHDHDHAHHGHGHHHHDESCGCGHDHHHDHHHHDADEVFTSWGRETAKRFSKEQLGAILDQLSDEGRFGHILRAKGIVEGVNGEWIAFDMVPGEKEIREGVPSYTGRLCVIGAQINEEALAELFGL